MNVQALKEMKNVDICSVSKASLVDIKDVKIDMKKERKERVTDFLQQIRNPYCFLCKGIIVKVNFSKTAETLEDKLNSYFLSI